MLRSALVHVLSVNPLTVERPCLLHYLHHNAEWQTSPFVYPNLGAALDAYREGIADKQTLERAFVESNGVNIHPIA